MSQLPIDEALNRFKDNESRLDKFINDGTGYTSSAGASVESLPAFLARQEQEIEETTGTVADNLALSNAAKTAAEAARDAAQLSSGLFEDTATGIAGTTNGQYFSVPSQSDSEYIILYKNVSAVAVEVKRYPAVGAFEKELTELNETQVIGRAIPPASGQNSSASTFVIMSPIQKDGKLKKVRAYNPSASVKTIKIRRFSLSGLTATQVVGSVDLEIALQSGLNEISVFYEVKAGEYLGYYTPAAGVAFNNAASDGNGWIAESGDLTTFTEAGAITTNVRLEIGFDIDAPSVSKVEFDALSSDVVDLEASVSSLETFSGDVATIDRVLIGEREYNASGAFKPGTGPTAFYEWSVGILRGSDIAEGERIETIGLTVAYSSGAETIKAMIYSRDTVGGTINSAPGQVGDVALWADWKSVNVSSLSFGSDVFGEIIFESDVALNDPSKSYYVLVQSFDSLGNRVPVGYGRANNVSYTQLQSGFYRQSSGATPWSAIATTAAIAVNIYKEKYVLNLRTEVESLVASIEKVLSNTPPSKENIGTRIFGGRMATVFDNSTPKTFRTVFTLASHFDEVRVIFAHAGTSPVSIACAAVASVASASNFALAGVSWQGLKFNELDSAQIPARPGSNRRGYLVSDWLDISSLTRTDDASALPLLAVSAYIDSAASLTLLGASGGVDSFTNWASHPTRPHVMRYNNGDCITTPENFTDETNRSTSPIVGVQYKARGKVITVMCAGDSISDGRGTYLNGNFAFQACNDKQNSHVAFDYCNIAWSGVGPTDIKNQVVDILSAGIRPDVMFIPNGTPNSITPPIDSTKINTLRTQAKEAVNLALAAGVVPIVWTMLPTNPSVKDYNSSDSLRRDYNDEWRLFASNKGGVIVADMDSVIAGTIDGDGQVPMKSGSTTDGIHPNDSGEADMKVIARSAIEATMPLLGFYGGSLITS